MKAKMIIQSIYESEMDFIHGFSVVVRRLVFEDNFKRVLVITHHKDEMHAFWVDRIEDLGTYKIFREIDISDDIASIFANRAMDFIQAKIHFDAMKDVFDSCINDEKKETSKKDGSHEQ